MAVLDPLKVTITNWTGSSYFTRLRWETKFSKKWIELILHETFLLLLKIFRRSEDVDCARLPEWSQEGNAHYPIQ
jgi:hypothetical protein